MALIPSWLLLTVTAAILAFSPASSFPCRSRSRTTRPFLVSGRSSFTLVRNAARDPLENTTSSGAFSLPSMSDEELLLTISRFETNDTVMELKDSQDSILMQTKKSSFPPLPGAHFIDSYIKAPIVEVASGGLVVLSSILVAVTTIPSLEVHVLRELTSIEDAIAYLFFVEFILRWYSRFDKEPNYLTRPLVLVDVFVVVLPVTLIFLQHGPASDLVGQFIPSWLVGQSALVNLRLLRILRLQRVLQDLETFASFQTALGLRVREVQVYQLQLARILLSLFTLLSVSTGLIYTAEHRVNPEIPDYFTALYFGITTLTTVGFGDVTPITAQGKFVVSASVMAGVAVIPAQAASLVEALIDFDKQKQQQRQKIAQKSSTTSSISQPGDGIPRDGMLDTRNPCPTCGATFHWSDALFCWSCGNEL